MHWIIGSVVDGHGVASGRSKQDQFPGGILAIQRPVFATLGVDLGEVYNGTINVDVSPHRLVLVAPPVTLEHVTWMDGYPAETFSFAPARMRRSGQEHAAMLYYPHPETKPEHEQPAGVIELLAGWIDGLATGDELEMWIDTAHARFV